MTKTQKELSAYLSNVLGVQALPEQVKDIIKIVTGNLIKDDTKKEKV